MAWRKWLVRGLVFSILGAAILAVCLYQAWTNPSAVRGQVLDKLGKQFLGATISLDSARLRLLGGIAVNDLRMARRDDLDRGDFLYVPSAVIHHDKEHLLKGALGTRKIELDRPHLRIVRERNGQLNLAGLLAPPDLSERVPTLIVRHGTILIEDRSLAGGGTLVEIKDADFTVTNDPLTTLCLEGTGQTDVAGPIRIQARFHRPSGAASAVIDVPDVPVRPALLQRLSALRPDCAAHLRPLRGSGKIQATLLYCPDAVEPFRYEVRCRLTRGEWRHERLPLPLEEIDASLRCVNGRVPEARLTARSGAAEFEVAFKDLLWPSQTPVNVDEIVREMDVEVKHLQVTDQLLEQLPRTCKEIQRRYSPSGPVSLTYRFRKTGADRWHKSWDIRPEGMCGEFEYFHYPIEAIAGSLRVEQSSEGENAIAVNLNGKASGRPLTLTGTIRGEKAGEVDLIVAADDVPVDHKLLRALPQKSRDLARKFLPARSRELGSSPRPLGLVQPAGLANIKVFIHRKAGQEHFANRYLAAFHHTSVKYDLFPLALENVSGVLDIQPDHWECQSVRGSHKGGEIHVDACSYRMAEESHTGSAAVPTQRECVQVSIRGRDIPLDAEFEQALAPPEASGRAALRNAWAMLALKGRLSFEAMVRDHPEQPQDIDVAVDIRGCTMRPEFFRYSMSDVSARVRYAHGRVYVKDVSAKHGRCQLGFKEGTIELKTGGGFRAWFQDLRGKDLICDEEFLRALHPALRKGLEPLHIRNPIDVETKLTLDAPSAPGQPMKIWWDGGALLRQQIMRTGLEISGMDGQICCHGHHNGRQFEGVDGYAVLERADILGQPFTNVQARIRIDPDTPDILRLYDLRADLFGGFIGGEARIDFRTGLSYEAKLDALQVQLDQFGKHNRLGADAQLQGPAQAQLYLRGEGSDLSGLKGNGLVEVPNGKLYRLPLLLDLLKVFGLREPDRTAFEQARMLFAIEGPLMLVKALDLYGNAISLRGQGSLNLDGSNLNLDFSTDWGRVPQMLPAGISNPLQAISDQLFKIKVRGKISAPRFEKEFIPGVVGPIKKALKGS